MARFWALRYASPKPHHSRRGLTQVLAALDTLDARRLEHANQTLARGRVALSNDPNTGLYWIKSALRLRATTLVKANLPEADAAIQELVSEAVRLHEELGIPLPLSEKNDLIILALSQNDTALASRLVSVAHALDDYPFTQELQRLLAHGLQAASPSPTSQGKLEPVEQLLIAELADIVAGRSTDLTGADSFWSRTRKKRHANTIHEHRNFYKAALASLQGS